MRFRPAILTAALAAITALGDDPMPTPPTVDQAVEKAVAARKKEAAAKAEREAADKILREVLAALSAKLKDLGLDAVTPDVPKPIEPPKPGPLTEDEAKLQYAYGFDKTEPATKAAKLAALAAVYRQAVMFSQDKELPTAADVLGGVREAVDARVNEGETQYLEPLRRAIADVYLNPRLRTLTRTAPLTAEDRKLIGDTYKAVADALAKLK